MAKTPQTDNQPEAQGEAGVDPLRETIARAAREPERNVVMDEGTRELLRLVNGGERQMVEALAQLKVAFRGEATGASELFGAVIDAIKEQAQAVRNAAMNHAVYIADKAAMTG